MNIELPLSKVLSPNSVRNPISTKSHLKEVYPEFFSDFTGWQDHTLSESATFQPHFSSHSPIHVRRKNGTKELFPLKKIANTERKAQNSLPEVVSAYEISKIHPRYKEFFDQPLKSFREKERFPAINNKSLLSVYLPSSFERRAGGKGIEKVLNQRIFDRIFRKEKKNKCKGKEGIEKFGKFLTVYNDFK